jgi:hypothetical protein
MCLSGFVNGCGGTLAILGRPLGLLLENAQVRHWLLHAADAGMRH